MNKPFEPKLLTCHNWSGAASGELDPGQEAEALNRPFNGAWLTTYMIRRFGPPNAGSDDHKNLCAWTLTTPIEGLALLVCPYVGEDGTTSHQQCLHFGYRYSDKLAKAINKSERKSRRIDEHLARVWKWQHRKFLVMHPSKIGTRRLILKTNEDGVEPKPEDAALVEATSKDRAKKPDGCHWLSRKEFHLVYFDLSMEYRKAYPRKPKEQPHYPYKRQFSLEARKCNFALRASIKSLLQPIFVRDVGIGVGGQIKDEDIHGVCAKAFEFAGYPCKVDKE